MTSKRTSYGRNAGIRSFTLVELLVVLAIVGILAVLSAGAFTYLARSSALLTATQILKGELEFARQTAITRDASVEFRLYQTPNSSGNMGNYTAFQSFLVNGTGTNAITKVSYLPQLVGVSTNAALTSFVSIGNVAGSSLNQSIPIYNQNYNALAFRFNSKGGLQLGVTTKWYLTMIVQNDPIKANSLPANYSVIQVDPVTGQASVFRP